jgi:hypothetical protein
MTTPAHPAGRLLRALRLPASLTVALSAILGANLACAAPVTDGPDPSYAPDGPYLHEVLVPAASRAHEAYAILLCRAADVSATPLTLASVQQLFLQSGQGTGNVYDYFLNMSYGSIDLNGSQVYVGSGTSGLNTLGWYTMTTTQRTLAARNLSSRPQTDSDCQTAAAKDGFDRSKYVGVVDIINTPTDSGYARPTAGMQVAATWLSVIQQTSVAR